MIKVYTEEEYNLTKSQDKLPLKCEYCGQIFYRMKKEITHSIKTKRRCRFCSHECANKFHGNTEHKKHIVCCTNCKKEIKVNHCEYEKSQTKHFFCCHSCSAQYNNKLRKPKTKEEKEKISNSLKKSYAQKQKTLHNQGSHHRNNFERKKHLCKVCSKSYVFGEEGTTRVVCSKECSIELRKNRKKYLTEETILKLRESGKKSAQIQGEKRRSKNEKLFFELCENYFKDVKHNKAMFNGWDADIIIEDIKYAVLWNGKWHYEKITKKHSFKQVQNRDRIKIAEIKKCGYTPYIIKDMGKYKPQFVEEEFNKFIGLIHCENNE